MVLEPTPEDEIEQSIESRLRGRISKLTNFVSTSFNQLFLGAFAGELRKYEVRLLAAQLSGWVDYAGGPITEDDLNRLGLREFDDIDLLNEFMLDEHLDNLGSIVGVGRDLGQPATGQVTVDCFDQNTRVPDGMLVSTPPNFEGETLTFAVDIDSNYVTPADQNNQDFVVVDVIAQENGTEYNVGANRISRLRSPPPGIEGVSNAAATTGGEDRETNDELRGRIKNAIFANSGGGTTEGIKGYILNNVDGVNDVFIDEFLNQQPIYVDVIVDGGVTSDVEDAIETSRPAGVRHNLVRPTTYNIGLSVEVEGSDIDRAQIKETIENYIFSLDLGEDFIEDRVVQQVLNIEPDVDNILSINTRVIDVQNQRTTFSSGTNIYALAESPLGYIESEQHYYESSTDIYELDVAPVDSGTVSIDAVVNGTKQTVSGSEYSLIDDDGDGMLDSIDWSTGNTTPDSGTIFDVTYDCKTSASEQFTYTGSSDFPLTYLPALAADSSVSDQQANTYTLGTDYDIVDDDGDGEKETFRWLSGGSTPANKDMFTVDYEVNVGSIESVTGTLSGTSGHSFVEGTDFNEVDNNSDTYADSIDWSVGGDDPDADTEFSVDMSVQNDIDEDYDVTPREKISPIVGEINVRQYD